VGFKPDILDMDIMDKVLEVRNQFESIVVLNNSSHLTESTHVTGEG
jgi:hypothetical protein